MSNLTIYFKSGNIVTIDKVTAWEVGCNNDNITHLSVSQTKTGFFKCKRRLIIKSIDLNGIECIIEH